MRIAGDGDEHDVVAAGGFDLAAADKAAAVGEQDDLEQDGGVVGGRAFGVVLVAGVEGGEVELVIDQVAQRIFEAAGLDLPVEVDRDQFQALVDRFEARHAGFPPQEFLRRRIIAAAAVLGVFLQRQRSS